MKERVRVTRCRDCKSFVPQCGCMFFDNAFVDADFFCAAAEPKESDFSKSSAQGYRVIARNERAALLFRESCPECAFVVAWGYDDSTGTWSHGNYLSDYSAAIERMGE